MLFARSLDIKLAQMDRGEAKAVALSLLQPNPQAALSAAVMLHDIETLSVPWISDCLENMKGGSLLFIMESWETGRLPSDNALKSVLETTGLHNQGFRPLCEPDVVKHCGAMWPFPFITLMVYLTETLVLLRGIDS
jgi:hypothetical protein